MRHFFSDQILKTLLSLHARIGKKVLCLDFGMDLLCEYCQNFLKDIPDAPYLDKSLVLNVRIVNVFSPQTSMLTVGLFVHFLRKVFLLKNLHHLNLFQIPVQIRKELVEDWLAPNRIYFSRIRNFKLMETFDYRKLSIVLGELN